MLGKMPSPKSLPTFLVFVPVRACLSSLNSSHHRESMLTQTKVDKGQVPCSRSHKWFIAEPVLNPARQGDIWVVTLLHCLLIIFLQTHAWSHCVSHCKVLAICTRSFLIWNWMWRLTSCMAFSKLLYLSEPSSPHLSKGEYNNTCLGCGWWWQFANDW